MRLFFFPRDSRFSFSYSRRRLLADDCFLRGFLSEEGGLFRFRALMPWKTPLRYLSGFSSFLGFLKLP